MPNASLTLVFAQTVRGPGGWGRVVVGGRGWDVGRFWGGGPISRCNSAILVRY